MVDEEGGLRGSYELCEEQVRRHLPTLWAASNVLPAPVRPFLHAIHGWTVETDRIADEGPREERAQRLAAWRDASLAEVREGRSEHPLRQAFVDTVCRWQLQPALIEEHLAAVAADCAAPPVFTTLADQRRFLRGITGVVGELWAPLLQAQGQLRPVSALFEACKVADMFEDLPADLAQGRFYWPREDLRRCGLTVDQVQRGGAPMEVLDAAPAEGFSAAPTDASGAASTDALDAFVDLQLAHWKELLDEAVPATWSVGEAYRPFLHTLLLGAQLHHDEASLLRSRVLTEGVAPLTLDGDVRPRPPVPAAGPGHVAVIMDGNRRWAQARGVSAYQGHYAGWRAAMRLVNSALRLGIRHLSVYAFSTENWNRSREETAALFDVLADGLSWGVRWLHGLGVQVRWCGRRDRLEPSLASSIALVENMTSGNDVLLLNLCVDYGGREELAFAARALAAEAVAGTIRAEDITAADLARHLYVPELPDVDLLIRTSGEQRISNFLPWQLSYAELVFDPVAWPDYDLPRLRSAVTAYDGRERRFGGRPFTSSSAACTPPPRSHAPAPSPS